MNSLEQMNNRDYSVFPAIFIAKFEVVPEILYDKNRRSSLAFWCEKEGFTPLDTDMDMKALGLNGLSKPSSFSPKAKTSKPTNEERCNNEEWQPTALKKVVIYRYKNIKRIVKKHV